MLTWINENAKWVIAIFAVGIALGLLAMDRTPEQSHQYPIGRVDGVCAEGVGVGIGEQEVGREEFGPHFFIQFAGQSVGDALTRVDKAARQVERAFGRFAATHHTEQLVKVVDHYSHGSCGGIGVEREAAVSTPFAVGIVRFEAAAAAVRAEQEVVKGV